MIHTAAISLADVAVGIELACVLALAWIAWRAVKRARRADAWHVLELHEAWGMADHWRIECELVEEELSKLPKRAPNGRLVSRRVK